MNAASQASHGGDPACAPGARKWVVVQRLSLPITLIVIVLVAASPQPAMAKTVKKGAHGAIALDRESGQFGYATDATTSRAAKMEALRQCVQPRCEVVASFRSACGALARGSKKYFPATGATRPEAEAKARRLCADKDCEVVTWACTR